MTSTTDGWLGALPDAWAVVPSKAAFSERREPNRPHDVHLTPSQVHGVLPQSEYVARTGNSVVQNLQGQDSMKHVQPDDFIIHLRSFQGGIERSTYSGKVSTAYTVLKPREGVVADYFRWLLKSAGYVQELRTTTNQLRDGQSIKFRDFAKVPLPLPPQSQQRAIADYLDREVAQIDTLIDEQQRLIALLRERRRAVVEDAVSDVPTSGARLKHLIRSVRQGWSPQCYAWPADGIDEWAVLKAGAANGGRFRPSENKALPEDESPRPDITVTRGDLLVSRANTRDLVGSAAVAEGDFPRLMLCDKLYAFSLDERRADPRFVAAVLGSRRWRDLIELEATGASHSMLNISQSDIVNLPMSLPPLDEQCRIVRRLDAEFVKLDDLIAETGRFVDLAHERRSALITAAVVGQIDVLAVA